MQTVLLWNDMAQVADKMDASVFQYIGEHQTESFESFKNYDLMAFDWYDVHKAGKSGKVLVYIDREDLFFFCRDEAAQQYVHGTVQELTAAAPMDNQQLLYLFFTRLFKGDMVYLEKLEGRINEGENLILEGRSHSDAPRRIAAWRRELLRLKRYYEQLDAIFDEMCANDNGLLSPETLARLEVLGRRTDRYLQKVCALQELVAQLREAYQSQLSIQQNDLMRVFTIVTVLFLPLTLITGWFGMNFANMPELQSEWGYPVIIAASVLLVAGLLFLLGLFIGRSTGGNDDDGPDDPPARDDRRPRRDRSRDRDRDRREGRRPVQTPERPRSTPRIVPREPVKKAAPPVRNWADFDIPLDDDEPAAPPAPKAAPQQTAAPVRDVVEETVDRTLADPPAPKDEADVRTMSLEDLLKDIHDM